ncbi:MAG: hypothetical protein ACK5HT_05310, partial [Draconibacterium sp.]
MFPVFRRKFWLSFVGFTRGSIHFYIILGINLLLLSITRFYPSMDGPAHLYNSTLLANLFSNNDII